MSTLNLKPPMFDVMCAGAQSLCHPLTWGSRFKQTLVPEGEPSPLVVVPLLAGPVAGEAGAVPAVPPAWDHPGAGSTRQRSRRHRGLAPLIADICRRPF